jgi:hypothetical protein
MNVSGVTELCRNLGVPPSSTALKGTSTGKSSRHIETVEFTTSVPPEQVEPYFSQNQYLKGWEGRGAASGGFRSLHFDNGKLSVRLTFDTSFNTAKNDEIRYQLNCMLKS